MEDKLVNEKTFLNILREKLSRGNKRSIHLNALPGNSATRIDITEIDLISKGFSERFLKNLLTKKSFKIEITFDDNIDLNQVDEKLAKRLVRTIRRLKSTGKQNHDFFLEHGVKPFGFGYPIIYKRDKYDPKSIIKAPLIIWSLEIEEDRRQVNKWTIKMEEDFPIYFNDLLITHIEKDEGIKISKLDKELLEDGIIDKDELIGVIDSFLMQFTGKPSVEQISSKLNKVIPCDAYKDKEEIINQIPLLSNSGIFGLYVNQKQSIIEDFNILIEDADEESENDDLINENFNINPFSAVDTDPTQQNVLNSFAKNQKIIIHGPPGTGKSQTLTAIITNALANNAKCLIVCEKRTALEVIYNNLKKCNLDKLVALIEDTSKDRRSVIDKARETIDNVNKRTYYYTNYRFDEDDFKKLLNVTKEIKNKILNFHKNISKQIFPKESWTSLVGTFLNNNKIADWRSLNDVIDDNLFEFTYEELEEYKTIIAEIDFYIDKYNPATNPLSKLNYNYIKTLDIISVETEILKEIKGIKNIVYSLEEECNKLINDYQNELYEDTSKFFNSISERITQLNKIYEEYSETKLFCNNKSIYNNFLVVSSIISRKNKEILNAKKEFKTIYSKLFTLNESKEYFKFPIPTINSVEQLDTIKKELDSYYINVQNWFDDIDKYINIQMDSFSLTEYFDFTSTTSRIKKFKSEFEKFEKEYSQCNTIIVKNISDYTFLIISAFLHNQIKIYEGINSSISCLNDYLSWNSFKAELKKIQQEIIDLLLNLEQTNYKELFQSWYLNKTLNNFYGKNKFEVDSNLEKLKENIDSLKTENLKKILTYWQERRIDSIFRFNNTSPINAKQFFTKTNHNGRKKSLRQIIQHDFELFTDIFPVILVNPSVCSSLFPLKQNIFDLVLFDEASQLRIEDTFCALIRGKHRIISGDEHQMPPSSYFQSTDFNLESEESEEQIDDEALKAQMEKDTIIDLAHKDSLLDYAIELNYYDADLQIHYRSRHPLLINFSNAAFYGTKLNPLPNKFDYKPIRFIQINGTYHNQINISEAKQVIEILKKNIFEKEDGSLPSVGIATFNIHQRNLIIDEIAKETNSNHEFGSKIDKLYDNGLFIKNLENIQGDERDIIIISTTFGKNKDGIFSERFGPLNIISKGHRLLNVIVTRAKYKIYVCTSFPEEKILTYKEHIYNLGNVGRGILYAYLAYAKAVESEDLDSVNFILGLLSEKCNVSKKDDEENIFGTESPFEQEVVDYLQKFGIPKERIELQYKCGGFRIDIIIKSKITKKPLIAIECDGASYHSSREAYLWDIFRQNQLEEYGFKFIRIWSKNWWLNPKAETEKIISQIDKIDAIDSSENEFKTYDENILDSELEIVTLQKKEVKALSKLTVKSIKTQKLLKLQLTDKQQMKFTHSDLHYVFNKTSFANSLIGKLEGDIIQNELSGEIFEIVKILE